MLDKKAYRDSVLLPLQKNAAQQSAVADALRALNKRSTGEQLDSATIAKDWLTAQGLLA